VIVALVAACLAAGCDGAFITVQAGELVAKAQSILAARESVPDSSGRSQAGAEAANKPAPGPR